MKKLILLLLFSQSIVLSQESIKPYMPLSGSWVLINRSVMSSINLI